MRNLYNLVYVDNKNNLFEKRNAMLKDANREIDLALFGDSITEGFDLNRYYPCNKTYINSAIGGDQVNVMCERFVEDVLQFNPKRVIFMGGINDLRRWKREGEVSELKIVKYIIDHIKMIIKQAQDYKVEIVICAIIKNNEFDLEPVYLNRLIDLINVELKDYCDDLNIDFIDYNQVLVDDTGLLSLNLCPDGLHPDHNGYVRMCELIKDYL